MTDFDYCRFHDYAFSLLGIEGLPLPRMDGFEDDHYLIESDYSILCSAVCENVPGIVRSDWWAMSMVERTECLRLAYEKVISSPPANEEAAVEKPKNPYAKKRINARMFEQLAKDFDDCCGWNCRVWADFLHCSKPSVTATDAWEMLELRRLNAKAENASKKANSKPRRKPKASDQRRAKGQD